MDSKANDSVESDVNASVIYFKDSRPYDVPGINNGFPSQKLSIAELLSEDRDCNPLMQPCEEGMIQYFHLPAKNMY